MAMTAKNVTDNGIFNTCLMITASGMLKPMISFTDSWARST